MNSTLPPDVPVENAATATPPVPAAAANTPVPLVVAKLKPPTPAALGLFDIPPTPAALPLVAEEKPPTATGGIVVGLNVKVVAGFDPACDAPMIVELKADVFPSASS